MFVLAAMTMVSTILPLKYTHTPLSESHSLYSTYRSVPQAFTNGTAPIYCTALGVIYVRATYDELRKKNAFMEVSRKR